MKVLVTGGSGFIGRHVVAEARRRGHSVRVLLRPSGQSLPFPLEAGGGIELVEQDLRVRDGLTAALHGIEAVIHCAASMAGDLETQRAVTVEGTRHLLAAMDEAGVKHIVGISTFALYDYQRIAVGTVLDEDSPLDLDLPDRDAYLQAKSEQEDLIKSHSIANGWRWTVVRPGIVFGRDRTWFYHLGVKLGPKIWVSYAGHSKLPLTYVENCAEAIVLAIEARAANGATLNIVDDDPPQRRRYLDLLAQRTNPRPTILEVPWALLGGASRAAAWFNRRLLRGRVKLPDLLQPASIQARCKPLRYTNERAKRVLGWQPRWSLSEGLERSLGEDPEHSSRI